MNYTQHIKGKPEEIFLLLCPQREKDWLDGWDYEIIFSESGLAEPNCVFQTPMHGEKATYWMVSRYEAPRLIEFVRFTPDEVVVKISIHLKQEKNGITPVEIAYIYTAITEKQEKYIQEQLPDDFRRSMEWWEKAMNYYLEKGEMLKKIAS